MTSTPAPPQIEPPDPNHLTILTNGPDIVGIATRTDSAYTIECPYCGNEQTTFALTGNDDPNPGLLEIRTAAAGLAAMAHNPGCPLYHNGRANPQDLQAPLF